jgi:hypothetical protein
MGRKMRASYVAFDPMDRAYPELVKVFAYWQRLKAGRIAPAWTDIDMLELESSVIPRASVVNTNPNHTDFTYRFWGTALTEMYHFDLSNKSIHELRPPALAETVLAQYQATARGGQPKGFLNEVPLELGIPKFYAIIRMPLSSDGVNIDMVMSVEGYSENRDKIREKFE